MSVHYYHFAICFWQTKSWWKTELLFNSVSGKLASHLTNSWNVFVSNIVNSINKDDRNFVFCFLFFFQFLFKCTDQEGGLLHFILGWMWVYIHSWSLIFIYVLIFNTDQFLYGKKLFVVIVIVVIVIFNLLWFTSVANGNLVYEMIYLQLIETLRCVNILNLFYSTRFTRYLKKIINFVVCQVNREFLYKYLNIQQFTWLYQLYEEVIKNKPPDL